MCWITSNECTQVYRCLLVKNSMVSFKPQQTLVYFYSKWALPSGCFRQTAQEHWGQFTLPVHKQYWLRAVQPRSRYWCASCTKRGTGGKDNRLERKFNLNHPSKTNISLSLRVHIIPEGSQTLRCVSALPNLGWVWRGWKPREKTGLLNFSRTALQNKRCGQAFRSFSQHSSSQEVWLSQTNWPT